MKYISDNQTYEEKEITIHPEDNDDNLKIGKNIGFPKKVTFRDLNIYCDFNEIKLTTLIFRNCNIILENKNQTINFNIILIDSTISELELIKFIGQTGGRDVIKNTNIKCKDFILDNVYLSLKSDTFLQSSIICDFFTNNSCSIQLMGFLIICIHKFLSNGPIITFVPDQNKKFFIPENRSEDEGKRISYSSNIIANSIEVNSELIVSSTVPNYFISGSSLIKGKFSTSNYSIIHCNHIENYQSLT